MSFTAGSLVRARGREWVVLPESTETLLVLRPLGGGESEIAGIYVGHGRSGAPLEPVVPAAFAPPTAERDLGSHLGGRLLRDAVRLGFRSAAGPFRSLARLGVEPRPYQLVPLLMALRLDPVRLLIADDVGVGKTIEACLIARELLDRGEIRRFTVLCPPHLAEQWVEALRDQFHLEPALVLASTAARLERECSIGESLFERYPVTVVSTDYIKQERRRHELLRSAPDLVIVDEAHTCALGGRVGGQQRHELLRALVRDPGRHLLLVTATPHSGDRDAFRSLLSLLDPAFVDLPEDLTGDRNRGKREAIARHLVQRRRGDIKKYMDTETAFPRREEADLAYDLSPKHRAFFGEILEFCRELVTDPSLDRRRARVRFWSALSLLRALSSSPRAAAATLSKRSGLTASASVEEADAEGRRAVFDLEDDPVEGMDVAPAAQPSDDAESELRSQFARFAKDARAHEGKEDTKLRALTSAVRKLLAEGRRPIVFCRFIETARYVGDELRAAMKRAEIVVVDGTLPHEEREARVRAMEAHEVRVLVTTDCLSEGINLQHLFDAVVHYDLAWNPTRHEQREGRVDRFGQPVDVVRALTMYGRNNPIDGHVLQVMLRRRGAIQKHLGVAVHVPEDTVALERAILEGELFRGQASAEQLSLFGYAHTPAVADADLVWREAEARERASRSLFAHEGLERVVNDELFQELTEVRRALGTDVDVERFVTTAIAALGGVVSADAPRMLDLSALPAAAREATAIRLRATFRGAPHAGTTLLTRTHPVVEGLARYVLETALDPVHALGSPVARRASVVRSTEVSIRTTLLLVRLRCHLEGKDARGRARELLAEDQLLVGFTGAPERAVFLDDAECERMLRVSPTANIDVDTAKSHLERVLQGLPLLSEPLGERARARGQALLEAHVRVRTATKGGLGGLSVRVHEPADLLGVYLFLPDTTRAGATS
ncbi:MAG: DEAD/DEAH box helicase [Myxococcales bacterium]|nr:DEAD/DEAH box helicase [Myxococcales bacterium]